MRGFTMYSSHSIPSSPIYVVEYRIEFRETQRVVDDVRQLI